MSQKKSINKCFSEGIVGSEMPILTKHKKNKEVTRKSQNVQLSEVDIINHDISSYKKKSMRESIKMDTETAKHTISSDDNGKLNTSIHEKQKNNKCSENMGISIDDCNLLSVSKPKKNGTKKLNASKHNKKQNDNKCILEDRDIAESLFVLTKHLEVNKELPNLQVSKVVTIDDISSDKKKKHKNRDTEKKEKLLNCNENMIYKECVTVVDGKDFRYIVSKKQKHLKESDCTIFMNDGKSSHLNCSKIDNNEENVSADNDLGDKRKKHKKKLRKTDAEEYVSCKEPNVINSEKSVKHGFNKSDDGCADNFLINKKQKHLKDSDYIILTNDGKSSNCSKFDKNEEFSINEENVSADKDLGDKRKKNKKKHRRKPDTEEYVTDRELNVINLKKSVKRRKSDDGCVDNFLINEKGNNLKESDYIILTDDGKSSDCSKIDKNEEFVINEENVSADDLGGKRKKHKKKHRRKTATEEYVTDRELNVINLKKSVKHRKSGDGCVDNFLINKKQEHLKESDYIILTYDDKSSNCSKIDKGEENVFEDNDLGHKKKKHKKKYRKTDAEEYVSERELNVINLEKSDKHRPNNEDNWELLQEVAITVSNKKSKENSMCRSLRHDMEFENTVDFPPIDFPISPLHEKSHVRFLSAEERKNFISMGIKIQTGRFTKNEDSILLKNWQDFVKKVGNDDPIMLLGIGQGVGRRSWKPLGIYLHLTRGLGNRTLYSIYRRARDLLHPNKKCKQLTVKNISNIKKSKLRHGNHWMKIGEHLGISGRTCETSYRSCNEQVTQGKFTEEEDQMLIKAVKEVMEKQGKILTAESVDTEGIPWETVASLIPTRNVFQCRQRWILYLSRNLFPEKRHKWSKREMAKVICLLKKNMVEDETLIDWRELNHTFFANYSLSHLFIMKKWYHKKYRVPKSEHVNHASIVNYLYSTYVPNVLKSLGLREEELFDPNEDFVQLDD